MRTSFDQALSIAEGISRRKTAEITALSYRPAPNDCWVAYFDTPKGTSYVEIEADTSFDRHLDDYEENFSADGSPPKEVLENDGDRFFIEAGRDLIIITRRNLGPYDDSKVACQVDIIVGDPERKIHHADASEALSDGGHATLRTYCSDDFEEV